MSFYCAEGVSRFGPPNLGPGEIVKMPTQEGDRTIVPKWVVASRPDSLGRVIIRRVKGNGEETLQVARWNLQGYVGR